MKTLLTLMLATSALWAQTPAPTPTPTPPAPKPAVVVSPPSLQGSTTPWMIELKVKNVPNGTAIIWDVFPEGVSTDRIIKSEQALLIAGPAGDYRVKVRLVKGEDVTELRWSGSLTGSVVPPTPTPTPTPTPVDPPKPPKDPSPLGNDGFRLLIKYDAKREQEYNAGQLNAIYGENVRKYLESHCVKGPGGEPERRIFDVNSPLTGQPDNWKKAMARPSGLMPWYIISNKTDWEEGVLPADPVKIMELLKKYGGE